MFVCKLSLSLKLVGDLLYIPFFGIKLSFKAWFNNVLWLLSLQICEGSARCQKCGREMSAYFCSICKHFTSLDENPYHCEDCGICW